MSKWIKVKDHLPELEERVLVYSANNYSSEPYVYEDRRRDFQGTICWIYAKNPTHWMPLPPPPSTETGE